MVLPVRNDTKGVPLIQAEGAGQELKACASGVPGPDAQREIGRPPETPA